MIDQLPRATKFWQAMLTDVQTVEQLVEMQERAKRADAEAPAERGGPEISTWTPTVEMLNTLVDAVRHLEQAVIATSGNKPGQWVPSARPWTAYDEVYARRRERQHEELVARLLPHKRRPSA